MNAKTLTSLLLLSFGIQAAEVPITGIRNAEIENNDNSNLATPLNAGVYMDGSLNSPLDRDFYVFVSHGNEILNFQICPPGFACNGKPAWVLYIFDGSKLTQAMEAAKVPLTLTRNDGGTSGPNGEANYFPQTTEQTHMYLLNEAGIFHDALLAIIDPCFGDATSISVGIPTLPPGTTRTYFAAVSSPLLRDTTPATGSPCGSGSVILTKPGQSLTAQTTTANLATHPARTVGTAQQYISVFPYNTDQYSISMTRSSGVSPLDINPSEEGEAIYNSSTGVVNIPHVSVNDQLYSVQLQQTAPMAVGQINFNITRMQALGSANPDFSYPFQGQYNPASNLVGLPRVLQPITNKAYYVNLLYIPSNNSLQYFSSVPLN